MIDMPHGSIPMERGERLEAIMNRRRLFARRVWEE
jgi:hypothetical protein